ncbi:spermatogenesis-associated protein 6 [Gracilinanus agilis]|uniref:spermatogenesis-associated protein 6 n=1 Tax=Gracilinanus agilis TaxID=191870 RepID=UPI001CFD961D|nr:spermatogenesis-associated protein 6 [Gracilinanus agilis]
MVGKWGSTPDSPWAGASRLPQRSLSSQESSTDMKISCPRLQLKDKEDVYLSVCVFGQYKKTECVPPIFPLVFNARMVFEKVFPDAIDPGDVVAQLEYDTAVFELIQLVLPVGETLSTYEENTRDFMFPGPKQMSGHHDSNRQVTMQRISGIRKYNFTSKDCFGCIPEILGLAPRLEFSTTSVITECLISSRKCRGVQDKLLCHANPAERSHGRMQMRGAARPSKKKSRSPERHKYCVNPRNYEQPTISSKCHSPSPYTKRRMCELSEDTRRRLAHLNLGPYEFKKDTDKPPFVIRHADTPNPKLEALLGYSGRESSREGWCKMHNDHTHLGSYRTKDYKITKTSHGRDREDSLDRCEEYLASRQSRPHNTDRNLLVHSAPSTMQKRSPSPVLNHSSLRERYHSDWCSPSNSDEIHERVKNVLKSHGTHQRCLYDERDQEKDEELDLKRSFAYKDSLCDSDPEYSRSSPLPSPLSPIGRHSLPAGSFPAASKYAHLPPPEKTSLDPSVPTSPGRLLTRPSIYNSSSLYRPRPLVHLDNGEYWSNRAAAYKGKSHRGNFENSMDKIYRNLYRKACGSSTQESL